MHSEFLKYFEEIQELNLEKKIAVAVSGGLDSLSLVLLANEWAKEKNIKVIALTVDHQLRPSSKMEAEYVGDILNKYNIKHHVLTWRGEKPKTNIENTARQNRYNLLIEFCKKNKIKNLLIGHHLQDQAENFLIRLFRGSNITGLSSMQTTNKRNNINLIRPFLNIKKETLKEYLVQNSIKWIEDESNSDEKYLRNKIRNFLDSFENKDDIIRRINSSVSTFQTAENIIKNQVDDLKNKIYFYNFEFNYYTLKLWDLLKLDKDLQYRIITKISKNISENVLNPRFSKLERLVNSLENLKKTTFYGCVFEKINTDEIVCYKEYNYIKNKSNYLKKGELSKYLKFLKNNNYPKYKKIKDFKGFKKEILYTLPVDDYKK